MSDTHRPAEDVQALVLEPSSWSERQKDIRGALLIGATIVVVLLGLLVWKGLF